MSFTSNLQNFWHKCVHGLNRLWNFFKRTFGFQSNMTSANNPNLDNSENDNVPIIIKPNELYDQLDLEHQNVLNILDNTNLDTTLNSDLIKTTTTDSLKNNSHKLNQFLGKDKLTDTEILFDIEQEVNMSGTTSFDAKEENDISDAASFVTAKDVDISDTTSFDVKEKNDISDTASFVTAKDVDISDTTSFDADREEDISGTASFVTAKDKSHTNPQKEASSSNKGKGLNLS